MDEMNGCVKLFRDCNGVVEGLYRSTRKIQRDKDGLNFNCRQRRRAASCALVARRWICAAFFRGRFHGRTLTARSLAFFARFAINRAFLVVQPRPQNLNKISQMMMSSPALRVPKLI